MSAPAVTNTMSAGSYEHVVHVGGDGVGENEGVSVGESVGVSDGLALGDRVGAGVGV